MFDRKIEGGELIAVDSDISNLYKLCVPGKIQLESILSEKK